MNLLLVLGVLAVVVLLVIGAANRKKLFLWTKAEASEIIDNKLDSLKVANQRIKEAEKLRIQVVNEAASLLAEEQMQDKQLKELRDKLDNAKNEAVAAKESCKKDLAIVKIKQIKQLEAQINTLEENKTVLQETRAKLELKNEKLRGQISNFKIQLSGLKARKATNEALSKINFDKVNNESLNESLDSEDIKISKEEIKLQYKMNIEELEDDDYSTEDLEGEYEKL